MRFGTRSLYDKHTRQSAAKHQTQWPLFTPRIRSLIALRLTYNLQKSQHYAAACEPNINISATIAARMAIPRATLTAKMFF
jgi:hypothetical protein